MRYRHRPTEVDVIRWMKPGDHPEECQCGGAQPHLRACVAHDELMLQPGDFVLTHKDGRHEVLGPVEFRMAYERAPELPHYAHL